MAKNVQGPVFEKTAEKDSPSKKVLDFCKSRLGGSFVVTRLEMVRHFPYAETQDYLWYQETLKKKKTGWILDETQNARLQEIEKGLKLDTTGGKYRHVFEQVVESLAQGATLVADEGAMNLADKSPKKASIERIRKTFQELVEKIHRHTDEEEIVDLEKKGVTLPGSDKRRERWRDAILCGMDFGKAFQETISPLLGEHKHVIVLSNRSYAQHFTGLTAETDMGLDENERRFEETGRLLVDFGTNAGSQELSKLTENVRITSRQEYLAVFEAGGGRLWEAAKREVGANKEKIELLNLIDRQNLANALLTGDPVLAKSLAGRGVPELDLMALRAALGARPFQGEPFDADVAVRALLALADMAKKDIQQDAASGTETDAGLEALARAGHALESAGKARVRLLAAKAVSAIRKPGITGPSDACAKLTDKIAGAIEKSSGAAQNGLMELSLALRTADATAAALGKSLDPHISQAPGGQLEAAYRPRFRVVDQNGDVAYDDVGKDAPADGSLLKALAGDTPGVTVIEADGGSGKSLLLAQAVRGWLAGGSDKDARVAYMDLAGEQIKADGGIKGLEEKIKLADVLVLDSLDEAIWADGDRTQDLDKKREKFSTWLGELAGEEKKIILTSRPGHWSGSGRRLRLPEFDDKRADEFVRDYLANSGLQEENLTILGKEWEEFRVKAKNDLRLTEVSGNPLTLLLLCEAVTGKIETQGAIGERKGFSGYAKNIGHLFEDVARMRLEKWERSSLKTGKFIVQNPRAIEKNKEAVEEILTSLGQLAYMMGASVSVTENDLEQCVTDGCMDVINAALEQGKDYANPLHLIVRKGDGGKLAFAHEKMREYFAARHVRRLTEQGINVPLVALPSGSVTPDEVPNFDNPDAYTNWRNNLLEIKKLSALAETCFSSWALTESERAYHEKRINTSELFTVIKKMAVRGGSECSKRVIQIAKKIAVRESLGEILTLSATHGGQQIAREAIQIAEKYLKGWDIKWELKNILVAAIRYGAPEMVREAIAIAEKRLNGDDSEMACILEAACGYGGPDIAREVVKIAEEKITTIHNSL